MRAWIQAIAMLVLSVGFVAVLRVPGLGDLTVNAISDLGQVLAAAFAMLAAAGAARRSAGHRRTAWSWLAVGMGSWCAGQCVWTFYELTGSEVPFPSFADVGFLGFPLAAGFGLVVWLGTQGNQAVARGRDVMDGAIIAVSLLVLSWVTALRSIIGSAERVSPFDLTLLVAYPLGDLVMATLVLLALARGAAGHRTTLTLLALGLVVFCLADSAFVYLTSTSTFSSADLVSNGGWFAGFLLMGVAGLNVRHEEVGSDVPVEATLSRTSRLRLGLTYLPLFVAGAVVVGDLLDAGAPRAELVLGVALVGLVLTRQFLAMTENQRLLAALGQARDQLHHQTLHDPLTGVANRVLFADRLERALLAPDADVSILFCDLDNFKRVNDDLGHDAGDTVLKLVATRLLDCVRVTDTVARLGGDEFAILLEDSRDAVAVADRVVAAMQEETVVAGTSVRPSISVGIARHHGEVATPDDDRRIAAHRRAIPAPPTLSTRQTTAALLLQRADAAMYVAKGDGRGRAVLADDRAAVAVGRSAEG